MFRLFVYLGAVGGDEATDEDKEKAEEEERERQEAIREAEERRKEKHRKMEEEREKMRQEIRDKVSRRIFLSFLPIYFNYVLTCSEIFHELFIERLYFMVEDFLFIEQFSLKAFFLHFSLFNDTEYFN